MMQHSPDQEAAPHAGSRRVRVSTLLFIGAALLLVVAIAGFVLDFGPEVVAVAVAPEATPTAMGVIDATPTAKAAGATPTATATPDIPPTSTPVLETTYVVKPGDTLLSIAGQFDVPVIALLQANGISAAQIRPGAIVTIPSVEPPVITATPELPTPPPSTPTASPTPTVTPTPTATPTATPPSGRLLMGYPLTLTVAGSQVVYVEIAADAMGAAGAPAPAPDEDAAGRIHVAVGEADALTQIERTVSIHPYMLAVLDAPAFDVRAVKPGAPETLDWRSLKDGAAVWTWSITARQEGKQPLAMQVYVADELPGPSTVVGEDVISELLWVTVLGESALAAWLKSDALRGALSPFAILLSIVVVVGGTLMRRKERLDRPVTGLPGVQVKQLQRALLSAFSTVESLEQLVRFRLDQNLAEISTRSNLADLVYDLIRWAEAHGQVNRLIEGALAENPDNPDLQQVGKQWHARPASTP